MTGRLDIDRAHGRRDRTLAGSRCVICEEPLEHTLRGERVFQLSCTHVAHEACFYEYIREPESDHCPRCDAPLELDASRGGNVVNLEKLIQTLPPLHSNDQQRTPQPTQQHIYSSRDFIESSSAAHAPRTTSHHRGSTENFENQARPRGKKQSNGMISAKASADRLNATVPRDDYDNETIQSPEPSVVRNSMGAVRSPIPPPVVIIRGEYPTLTHSRQPQSLTCLVTIEVPEGKWTPHADDFQNLVPIPVSGSVRDSVSVFSAVADKEEYFEPPEVLKIALEDLHARLDNWHGLDFSRFGKLRLHGKCYVGKDRQSWQELWCYLFEELLVCVKEKRILEPVRWAGGNEAAGRTKFSLKGSIQITRHLNRVESLPEHSILTLNLSVPELPYFNLHFQDPRAFEVWERALGTLNAAHHPSNVSDTDDSLLDSDDDDDEDDDEEEDDEEDDEYEDSVKEMMAGSSFGANRGNVQSAMANSYAGQTNALSGPLHVPVDIVVVLPISSSMHGLKISLLRDALRFIIQSLGPRDRVGLVTFGAADGAQPIVGMTTKAWEGWHQLVDSIRAVGHRGAKGDLIEGANVAMDLLMQRKSTNPLSTILIISDSASTEAESVDFVISRAEAAKVSIFCFGLGLTHKPDIMIELATRTKASYIYVKDWMMLRECVAGCLGSIQSTSHQGAKLKLRLPDGSPAKFVKISGALQVTKRSTGRDAEVMLGDLRFGDKRDILVQLAIESGNYGEQPTPVDPWESIVSGLEALGGPLESSDDGRHTSVEEVPILQADLVYGDLLRQGANTQLAHPSLLAITMLSGGGGGTTSRPRSGSHPDTPPIPAHPSVVQRRMELLTSDMLTRALSLVAHGQHERALHLLRETRSILKGLGKGSLPPIPTTASTTNTNVTPSPAASLKPPSTTASVSSTSAPPDPSTDTSSPIQPSGTSSTTLTPTSPTPAKPDPSSSSAAASASASSATAAAAATLAAARLPPTQPGTLDPATVGALDAELDSALEWIAHPAVFARDARKAVLQAIGVVSSQRGYTFRTGLEGLWAGRVRGVVEGVEAARQWRVGVGGELAEEA